MKIEFAVDWQDVRSKLRTEITMSGYNPDLNKMLKNIDLMVTELSKLEVSARRIQSATFTKTKVDEINKAIDHLEKLALIAKLMR
jgi:Fic family protein